MEHLFEFLCECFFLGREKRRGCTFVLLGGLAMLALCVALWLVFKP